MYLRYRKNINHNAENFAVTEAYFITICVLKKMCLFGKIALDKMLYTEFGEIIKNQIANMRHVIMINSVVMPNHIHLLFKLDEIESPEKQMLSNIIRDFKSYTTALYNKPHGDTMIPLWQRGYYDRRIRNDEEFQRVNTYIDSNPKRWAIDKFYIE